MLVYVYVYVSVHNYQKNDNMIIFIMNLCVRCGGHLRMSLKNMCLSAIFIHLFKQENALRTNCTHDDM